MGSEAMHGLVDRAKADSAFLYELISDPVRASKGFDLTDQERKALSANTASRLATLVSAGVLAAGCGSSPTCEATCTATCTVTFTSIADLFEVVRPQHG